MKTNVFCKIVPWRGRKFEGCGRRAVQIVWKGVDGFLGCYGVGRRRKLSKCGV